MHSVIHHGSVLQAYATQLLFESMGHNTYIINYKYPNEWQTKHGMKIFHPSLKTQIAMLLKLKAKYKGRQKIRKFMNKYYNLTKEYKNLKDIENNIPQYDVYISGSDQIWNPRFTCGDPAYFFSFLPEGSNIMSFSSSFACESLDNDIAIKYKNLLKRYKFISVRENQGAKLIKKLLNYVPPVTLDPTLMVEKEKWEKFIYKTDKAGKYIYLYILDYAFNPKPYIFEIAKYFSEKYKLEVICNSSIPKDFKIKHKVNKNVGIEDFLSLINNSFLVITSSFHGVAFSVNFKKPIIAVVDKDKKDDRLSSILNNLGLNECIAKIGTPAQNINPFYNQDIMSIELNKLRDKTKNYLQTSLSYFKNHQI